MVLLLLLLWGMGLPAPVRATEADPLEEGIALLRARRYEAAAVRFAAVRRRVPADPEAGLLLGIALYRAGALEQAEPLLREAAHHPDKELQATARLFLGLLYQAQGATDRAQGEFGRASAAERLGPGARRLAQGLRPRRLQASLLISPEYDGNVPLLSQDAWRQAPAQGHDGDVLLAGALTLRPVPSFGLQLGLNLSYRQQFRLQAFNLLLADAWLGYSYLGARHRLRVQGAFTFSLLGGQVLYLEGEGRAWYRLRLWHHLGLLASYVARHRDYRQEDFSGFTGNTHTGQLELGWGVLPDPVQANLGYEVRREELRPGAAPQEDFRALGHGPYLRVRARPRDRIELLLLGSALWRGFDLMPVEGGLRRDWQLSADLSLSADLARWLEGFVGGAIVYNRSNDAAFTYVKPLAYLGIAAHFTAL